jgi:nicotinate phosphoribosyltransferase
MKCSDSVSKAIIPGKLMAWRVYDEEGKGQCDIISLDSETIEAGKRIHVYDMDPDAFRKDRWLVPIRVEKILVPHLLNGELAIKLPTIEEKRDFVRDQLEHRVWESELRPEMPHQHYVDLTEGVHNLREELYSKLHGGSIG